MRYLIIIALCFLLTTEGIAHEVDRKVECSKINDEIRLIQSRMRAGYTRAQGERMETQLRKLRKKRKSKCR